MITPLRCCTFNSRDWNSGISNLKKFSLANLLGDFLNMCAWDLSFRGLINYTYEREDGFAHSWIDHIVYMLTVSFHSRDRSTPYVQVVTHQTTIHCAF